MKTVAAEEKDKTEKMNGEEPQEEAKEQETPAGEAEQSPCLLYTSPEPTRP